ncbi:uncharacterized protein [Triticum aestivum]|uniref:uncharacterized protein isoform X2 n=1 Tax=Triticum aestivum TaxID=4565 RepID=UPI001D0318D0|nr:uncharacterized protein LOC123088128 isoform X2 [Triticum aestivum]
MRNLRSTNLTSVSTSRRTEEDQGLQMPVPQGLPNKGSQKRNGLTKKGFALQVSLWSTLQEKTFLWKELQGVLHMANIDEGMMYAFTFRRKVLRANPTPSPQFLENVGSITSSIKIGGEGRAVSAASGRFRVGRPRRHWLSAMEESTPQLHDETLQRLHRHRFCPEVIWRWAAACEIYCRGVGHFPTGGRPASSPTSPLLALLAAVPSSTVRPGCILAWFFTPTDSSLLRTQTT